jgi:WD40 repeat protein
MGMRYGGRPQRFEGGHEVGGHRILFDVSADGMWLASGSADGVACVYTWSTAAVRRVVRAYAHTPCVDVAFCPSDPTTLATCSWDGAVTVWPGVLATLVP